MDFYVLPVLFPALLIDIVLTVNLLRDNPRLQAGKKALGALVASPLYFIASVILVFIFGQDPRFQEQGAIGLAVFLGVGIVFTILRLLVGLILLINLMRHK